MALYYYFSSLIAVATVQFETFLFYNSSLCSKRFRGAKSEERGFRRFARVKNGARAKLRRRGKDF